jgi:plasmid stability protein
MASVNRFELPDELMRAIERRAAAHAISVEQQIVQDLSLVEHELGALDEQELLALVRREREEMAARGITISAAELAEAKAWGRK